MSFFIKTAFASSSTIPIPNTLAGDIAANAGEMFSQLSGTTALILGVLLASVLISALIYAIKH